MKLRGRFQQPGSGGGSSGGRAFNLRHLQRGGGAYAGSVVEESIPFSGEVELSEAEESMIPFVPVRLLHQEIEMKPDSDGEMRVLLADAVLELDMKSTRSSMWSF